MRFHNNLFLIAMLISTPAIAGNGISEKYRDKVQYGRTIAAQSLSPEALLAIQEYDGRGLKLMSNHDEVIKFAQPEYGECQSVSDNYHRVNGIMKVGGNNHRNPIVCTSHRED